MTGPGHFDDFGIEAGGDFDQIGLGAHDLVDVLAGGGGFIEASAQERHAGGVELPPDIRPLEAALGFGPGHEPAGAMRSAMEGPGAYSSSIWRNSGWNSAAW